MVLIFSALNAATDLGPTPTKSRILWICLRTVTIFEPGLSLSLNVKSIDLFPVEALPLALELLLALELPLTLELLLALELPLMLELSLALALE